MSPWRSRRRMLALATTAVVGAACLSLIATNVVSARALSRGWNALFGNNKVGDVVNGRLLLPSNQWIAPIGTRIPVMSGRLVSSTLSPAVGTSPAGTYLAALTWNSFDGYLSIINVKTGKIVQQVNPLPGAGTALKDTTVGPDGPVYSPDGKFLWVCQSAFVVRFSVNADGTVDTSTGKATSPVLLMAPVSATLGAALPAGMAFSGDGSKLYVALNGLDTLGVIDDPGGASPSFDATQIPVGIAPRQVVVSGTTAFVSNEGGRVPQKGEFTNLTDDSAAAGSAVVASPVTGAAISGTVSVVDLTGKNPTASIRVGLEPSALCLAGGTLFVANSNRDSVSVIDTKTHAVTQTIHVNPIAGQHIGSNPNAISMPDPKHLLVSIGRDNAIAVYRYTDETTPVQLIGLLPTDWYPVQVQPDAALGAGQIVVTNDKGIGARAPDLKIAVVPTPSPGITPGTNPAVGYNTYGDTGTVTTFALPSDAQIAKYTSQVFANNGWDQSATCGSGRNGRDARSVIPAHRGERSPIKHIFVVIRENRTYDQVLGDVPDGNGDPADAQYGNTITPNQHALADRFGLFDNFYDVGTLSADGHNWIVQANANDYVEKEFGAFYRSYPAQGGDALAYQPDGFLWNAAQRAARTVDDFGEYANFFTAPSPASGGPSWADWYKDSQILEGKASGPLPVPIHQYMTYSDIPSLNGIIHPYYPKFDMDVPDQYRVDIWQMAFERAEKSGRLANLTLIWLPDDHTAGLTSGDPYPIAQVADNDLALGRIVQQVSHSRFWQSSAIFVMEDDTQNGVDHVDGHRGPFWVISPYSKPYSVDHTYYNQVDAVRTIEQILDIKPMNQEDGTAVPMYDAFTSHPDFAPFNALPSNVPLTLGAKGFSTKAGDAVRKMVAVPAAEKAIESQWIAWSNAQHLTGPKAAEDSVNPAQLNRLDWYTSHGWTVPYPGDKAVLAPDQVPGHNLPADYLGDD